jgi:hypothetical protein
MYPAQFMTTYEGSIPAVLCLQMHLMGCEVDIIHRANVFIGDANYWLRLDADLCYDSLFKEYLHIVSHLHSTFSKPLELPMQAANMPYYLRPYFHQDAKSPITPTNDDTPSDAQVQLSLFTDVNSTSSVILPLSIIPVHFGTYDNPAHSQNNPSIKYISKFPALAFRVTHFTWAVHSFSSGHFSLSIRSRNLPFFVVTLACDPFGYARALLSEFTGCHCLLPSALALLNHI